MYVVGVVVFMGQISLLSFKRFEYEVINESDPFILGILRTGREISELEMSIFLVGGYWTFDF